MSEAEMIRLDTTPPGARPDRGRYEDAEARSMALLPHGDAHIMASRPGLDPRPITELLPSDYAPGTGIPAIEGGRGGEVARFVCGYLHCDHRFNPLVGALPELIVAAPRRGLVEAEPAAAPGRSVRVAPMPTRPDTRSDDGAVADGAWTDSDRWLKTTLEYTMDEAMGDRPGSPAMLARLTEVLDVEVLRRYIRQLPEDATGWLAATRDREVGLALRLLHARPERKWTVDALAGEVGLSRSALAQRFSDLMGEPPMQYLAEWRMHLARQLLRQSTISIAQVAKRVGYGSHVAFRRASRRYVGEPPAAWRRAAV